MSPSPPLASSDSSGSRPKQPARARGAGVRRFRRRTGRPPARGCPGLGGIPHPEHRLRQSLGPGDTPLANTDADARLWPDVLSFLADPAGRTGTFTAPATPPALNAP